MQDKLLDNFFVLDLSDVVELDGIDFLLHNLEVSDKKSCISDHPTPSTIISTYNIPHNVPPDTQSFLNKYDDIGSQEYFLMVDTEVLSLVNNVEGSKVEQDDFSFLHKITELAMGSCATFHVYKDKYLFVGDIREAPDIIFKGVSGTSKAAGIGKTKFHITDKEGKSTETILKNVIYLPESPKNSISISRWPRDRGDGFGIMSRGEYSIFSGNTMNVNN